MAVFYARVDTDPVIRPLYGKTLSCAIRGLTDFMTTWLGGPPSTTFLPPGSAADTCRSPSTPRRETPGLPT